MKQKSISVVKKLEIVQKANGTGNIKDPAEVYEVQPKTVRFWRAQMQQMIRKLYINRRAKTVPTGNNARHPELESNVYSWVTNHITHVTVTVFNLSRNFRETLRMPSLAYIWTFTFGIFDRLLLCYINFRFRVREGTSLCLLHSKHCFWSR